MTTLILKPDSWSNVLASHLEIFYKQNFNISTNLNDEGIIYVHWLDYEWAQKLNRPTIVDNTWDPWESKKLVQTPNTKILSSDGWFCIANESLWYTKLGYTSFTATNENSHSFLMLMNQRRFHRDRLWDSIQPHLTNALYSYQAKGIKIAGDVPKDEAIWQRYFNPEWYNKTKYSLVVDTGITVEHSEKILKPCAFRHPFIVWGPPGYLKWLRGWGFETFDNCIDETYDTEHDHEKRLHKIIKEIERLNSTPPDYFMEPETQRRLDINYNRFYDTEWASTQIQEKIINAIKQYCNNW